MKLSVSIKGVNKEGVYCFCVLKKLEEQGIEFSRIFADGTSVLGVLAYCGGVDNIEKYFYDFCKYFNDLKNENIAKFPYKDFFRNIQLKQEIYTTVIDIDTEEKRLLNVNEILSFQDESEILAMIKSACSLNFSDGLYQHKGKRYMSSFTNISDIQEMFRGDRETKSIVVTQNNSKKSFNSMVSSDRLQADIVFKLDKYVSFKENVEKIYNTISDKKEYFNTIILE